MVTLLLVIHIRSLTTRQKQVLKRVCEGIEYKAIGEELFLSENTIKKHMANVYIKLGLTYLPLTLRKKILFETYCPAIQNLDFPLSVVDHKEPEEADEPEPVPEEVLKMVEEDQKSLIPYETEVIDVIPLRKEEKKKRRNTWKWILVLIILFLLVFGGIKLYEWANDFIGSFLTTPVQEEHQESQAQAVPTKTERSPDPTVIPTDTVVVPTSTPQPTAPPAPEILFFDDFSQGLSSGWQVVYGNPLLVNGMLTTDQNTLLMIGDTSWKNYSIEFTADPGFCWLSRAENWIIVRAKNTNDMYAYKWGECESYWFIVKNGVWNEVPQSDYNPGWETSNFRIEVEGGSMSVYGNGLLGSSIFDNTFTEGRIGLMIGENTTLDDFVVRELK